MHLRFPSRLLSVLALTMPPIATAQTQEGGSPKTSIASADLVGTWRLDMDNKWLREGLHWERGTTNGMPDSAKGYPVEVTIALRADSTWTMTKKVDRTRFGDSITYHEQGSGRWRLVSDSLVSIWDAGVVEKIARRGNGFAIGVRDAWLLIRPES